jgi:osmotically-inducible protein OsmY
MPNQEPRCLRPSRDLLPVPIPCPPSSIPFACIEGAGWRKWNVMRTKHVIAAVLVLTLAMIAGCSNNQKAAQQVKDTVDKSLKQVGFKDVTVDADADKKVVTLGGKVKTPEDKDKAGGAAQAAAQGWVVANQISIEPEGQEAAARKIEGNIDDAIEKTYDSLLIANHIDNEGIKFKSKNGLLTLEGKVKTAEIRTTAEQLGGTVPHVTQVVNKIDVKK